MLAVKLMEPLQAKQTEAPCREFWVGPRAAFQTYKHLCLQKAAVTHARILVHAHKHAALLCPETSDLNLLLSLSNT